MTKHKSEDYKISAVKYYLQKHTQKETCYIFECIPRSLMRWVHMIEKNYIAKRKHIRENIRRILNKNIFYFYKNRRLNC